MNTAKASAKFWKTPLLFALGISLAAILAAPAFVEPAQNSSGPTQLFSPYRAASEQAPQILAETHVAPASKATR